ncbi:Protein of uncharacterised function (DUF3102) [Streptococcus dysgalactiae subsp. dysgalactiae]|uniref:DUF3102 domain-containing protein n=1 Tax=Streptococcus dysgalactiae TaxID=1334 RepID=UPI000F716583|nr:DUF3102 domain-containing protein [Streptococcus dysgalactiae]VDZ39784.1 Protein of uncharacterised function (DUF3102) [Streptococcus dysgalactiae subsp. dysgalactiae]
MNELTLSNNLQQIELEINHHKNIAGQSIWEIGRRLNHVKENDLAHGQFTEWVEKQGINYREANRMMTVAKQLPNVTTLSDLGTSALYLIATLPDDKKQEQIERIENGDNPTVRELQEIKRENNRLKAENARLEQQAGQVLGAKVVEKEVVVEKIPDDYNYFKSNYEASKGVQDFYKNQNAELREEIKELEKIIKSQRDSSASQLELQKLEDKKATLNSEIKSLDKIAEFQEGVENFITDNASISYTKDFENLYSNRDLTLSLLDTFNRLEKWIDDIKSILPNGNIIEGE